MVVLKYYHVEAAFSIIEVLHNWRVLALVVATAGESPCPALSPNLCVKMLRRWLKKWNERMKFRTNSGNFCHFPNFLAFFQNLETVCHLLTTVVKWSDHFCEIPANFHENFAEKSQNPSKNANDMKWIFFIPPKMLTIFCWNFEIWTVQKYENLVDLEKCCKMTIWLLS